MNRDLIGLKLRFGKYKWKIIDWNPPRVHAYL